MRLGGALGEATPQQGSIGGVGGDTVSPPVVPSTGCYHGHGGQGREKIMCV